MGWEKDGRYYTRSSRVDGRVVREYVGSGELPVLSARLDAIHRGQRQEERQQERQQGQALQAEDKELRAYCQAVETVLRAVLTGAGYHQHARGTWRKRRGAQKMDRQNMETLKAVQEERARRKAITEQAKAPGTEIAAPKDIVPATREERQDLTMNVINGKDARVEAALACIEQYPLEVQLAWGNPKNPCLDMVAPSPGMQAATVIRAVIEKEYDFKLTQVAGDNPTPLEKMLAERIVSLRLLLTHWERTYEAKLSATMSLALCSHHQKRIERTEKRYVSAIKSLAQVRRLQLPIQVQVNIAEKQINLAGGNPSLSGERSA